METPLVPTAELANPSDFETILLMYHQANEVLMAEGIIQWNDEYPSPAVLLDNLARGNTWVFRHHSQPIATVTLDEDQDPQYQFIRWAYVSNRVLVVHRLCVAPGFQKLGLARRLMEFVESYAGLHRYQAIRLDAYLGNPYSQKLYRSLGYHEAGGYCYYHPGQIMCNCFEKWVA